MSSHKTFHLRDLDLPRAELAVWAAGDLTSGGTALVQGRGRGDARGRGDGTGDAGDSVVSAWLRVP